MGDTKLGLRVDIGEAASIALGLRRSSTEPTPA